MDDIKLIVGSILYNAEMYIPYSFGALYDLVDGFVVVNHNSSDRTVDILKEMDTQKKIVIINRPWNNNYSDARNTYLKFIRDQIWNPGIDRLYYWRVDDDEIYGGEHLKDLKSYIDKNRDKQGFRFNFATFDTDHFHLNEVNPKETRANLFLFNPGIRYENSIHEMPVYRTHGFAQPLYGGESADFDLGIQEVPPEYAWYAHMAYCDEKRCAKKIMNYTEQYVKQGTVTPERLQALKNGDNWAWRDHKSALKADQLAYPSVLKTAPFMQNPPFRIAYEDGTVSEPTKETVQA